RRGRHSGGRVDALGHAPRQDDGHPGDWQVCQLQGRQPDSLPCQSGGCRHASMGSRRPLAPNWAAAGARVAAGRNEKPGKGLVVGLQILRGGEFPRWLGYVALIAGVDMLLLFFADLAGAGTLVLLTGGPAALILGPAMWIGIG